MKFFSLRISVYLFLILLLAACEPTPVDSQLGASSGDTTNGSGLGLFDLLYDDYDGGDLQNGDIEVTFGEQSGSGSNASPLEFTLGTIYTVTTDVAVSENSHLLFSLYSPEAPENQIPIAVLPCDSSISNSCNDSKKFDCWFSAGFHCKREGTAPSEPADIDTLSSRGSMVMHFIEGWAGDGTDDWSEVDLTVGLQVKLCNGIVDRLEDVPDTATCDLATLGFVHFEQYTP